MARRDGLCRADRLRPAAPPGSDLAHRLRAGFPTADVAGKTGTLAAIRNEIGVVTFDEEYPVAVAVFTHAARADTAVPRADAAIARAARRAVTVLRCARL